MLRAVLAGAASMVACSCCHPIDTIKIRMQLQKPLADGTLKYPGMIRGIQIIAAEEGLKGGVYKGIEGALMRESIYSTMRLGMYEPIKRMTGVQKDSNFIYKFFAGGLSGFIGSGIANPCDLLKIRMQASEAGTNHGLGWHINDIYSHEGIKGFWRGVGPTMVRATLMNGTKLGVYDTIKQKLKKAGVKDGV